MEYLPFLALTIEEFLPKRLISYLLRRWMKEDKKIYAFVVTFALW